MAVLHATGSPCHVVDYSSLQGSALLGGVNILHSAFPADADEEYKTQGNHKILYGHVQNMYDIGQGWNFMRDVLY